MTPLGWEHRFRARLQAKAKQLLPLSRPQQHRNWARYGLSHQVETLMGNSYSPRALGSCQGKTEPQ